MITTLIIIVLITSVLLGIKKIGEYDNPKLFRIFIKKYLKQDKINFPKPDLILFTGSSIIKFWKTMENDLSPFYVLNRGVAGTKINEIAYWVEELVVQYKPKAVLLYAGSNDIQGKKPKTPEHVFNGFISFSNKIHQNLPNTKLFYISILPSPAKTRWKHWSNIQKANLLIKEYCNTNKLFKYIEISADFLDSNGLPNKTLFKKDMIHLNENGYKVWTSILRPELEKI